MDWKDEILVSKSIIGIPTDALVTPSLYTHVIGHTVREIEPKTYDV
jgi:hypothetical protein